MLEFLNYDSATQYHEMFLQDGTAEAIQRLKQEDEWQKGTMEVPKELRTIILANARDEELHEYGVFS